MESYQASVIASCYLLFSALVCRGFSSSMLTWSGSTRHSLVKRMCSLRRLPAYVCSSARVGLHGAFSQGHWGQIWTCLRWNFWSLWKTWWPFSCRSCDTHLDRICCRCAAMWWSSMATPRIGGLCVQQLWPAPLILSISRAPCATPAPGRRPSAMLFAVGIAKDLWTEKITFRCKGWVIVICVAFFWLKKCALVLDPNFRMWRLCATRWSMMGSSLWFCWKRPWSLRERLGFRVHVSLQQFCRNMCDK